MAISEKLILPSEKRLLSRPTDDAFVRKIGQLGFKTVMQTGCTLTDTVDDGLAELDREGSIRLITLAHESSIPAMAAGRYLATGEVVLQKAQNTTL